MKTTIPIALTLALLAGCAEPITTTPTESADVAATSTEVEALRAQMAEMNRTIERLQRRAPAERSPKAVDTDARKQLDAALERITVLETQLAEQAAAHGSTAREDDDRSKALDALRHLVGRRRAKLTAEDIVTTQRKAVDAASPVDERLQALRTLRGQKDGRSREVVLAMIDLFRTSDDPKVRADIFRQLHRVTTPELEQPLIDALRSDPDSDVREEAAETLDHYLDSPAARQALEDAAANDSDRGVRRQARESLEEHK